MKYASTSFFDCENRGVIMMFLFLSASGTTKDFADPDNVFSSGVLILNKDLSEALRKKSLEEI